eukprot:GHRQ01000710.1.p1 GENE.GHRQ01000710.1~~GHRQ01000710.1.p1  ORF type:complete len:379 (+),score=140.48 GHRQ01000710.1:319-1455(+)
MATVAAHNAAPAGSSSTARTPSSNIDVKTVTDHSVVKNKDGFSVRTWAGGNGQFWWGLASAQGRRPNMEDAHLVDLHIDDQGTALFGVFDGHAGKEVASYCAQHMRQALLASPSYAAGKMEEGLAEAFLAVEQQMKQLSARHELYCLREGISPEELRSNPDLLSKADSYGQVDAQGSYLGPKAGAAVSVAAVRGDRVSVAHVGDSRCVLGDNGHAVAMTRDHKASEPDESKRVVRAGLSVVRNRVTTNNSSLAMTRSLGDTKYKQGNLPMHKQAVTPVPETSTVPVDMLGGAAAGTPAVEQLGVADFLLLACDGLWDCMTNQQAVTYLSVALEKGLTPHDAVLALVEEVLDPHSRTPASADNVTALLVQFAPMPDVSA